MDTAEFCDITVAWQSILKQASQFSRGELSANCRWYGRAPSEIDSPTSDPQNVSWHCGASRDDAPLETSYSFVTSPLNGIENSSNDTDVREVTPTATVAPEQEEPDMRAEKGPYLNVVRDLTRPAHGETASGKRRWRDYTGVKFLHS